MSYRTPGSPFAGEPDPWEARADTRRRPAPWHSAYGEERSSASDYARRSHRSRPPERRPYQRTEYRGLQNSATADEFRDLARSIEQMRTRGVAPAEPARHSSASARTTSGWSAARGASTPQPRSTASTRDSTSRYSPTTRNSGDARLGQVARDIVSAADKSDVRRLERLLNEVLERLDALGHAPEPHSYARRDEDRDEPNAWRSSTTGRRTERRSEEREEGTQRQANFDRRTERREADETQERPRSGERRRGAETSRPSDFVAQYEPAPPRGSSRASKPRRLFT
jgi:hypothetical protein